MKKNLIRVLTVIFIAIASTGCTNKNVTTPTTFSGLFKNKGYEIVDATEQYNNKKEINKIILATKEDSQIEYFIFNSDEVASDYLNDNLKVLTSSLQPAKTEGKNYVKYVFSTKNNQIIISKVENTIIYVIASAEHQAEITELLKVIDY